MLGRLKLARLVFLVIVVVLLTMLGCSTHENPTGPDVTPPRAVVDLVAASPTSSSIALTWTASGDDSATGTASYYDIRYSHSLITDANWESAATVSGEPTPKVAGSRETFVVTGLSASTGYYFALKVGDKKPNWSGLSNVVSGTTRAGSGWFALGSGMSGFVRALTEYNGQLIAGGDFTIAGGVSANHIAAWNGNSWSPLGSGISGSVRALTEYNGQLIAGGWFNIAGGASANYIAAWNGSSWSPLAGGMNGPVLAFTVYNGRLIAGGWFSAAGGVSANDIAAWDGSSWSPLAIGMNAYVEALTEYNGQLIAGGQFSAAGGVSANFIAAWSD